MFSPFPPYRLVSTGRKGRTWAAKYHVLDLGDGEQNTELLWIIMCFTAWIGSATSSIFSSHLPRVHLPMLTPALVQPSYVTWRQEAGKELGQRKWSYPSLNLVSALKHRLKLSFKLSPLSRAVLRNRKSNVQSCMSLSLALLCWLGFPSWFWPCLGAMICPGHLDSHLTQVTFPRPAPLLLLGCCGSAPLSPSASGFPACMGSSCSACSLAQILLWCK